MEHNSLFLDCCALILCMLLILVVIYFACRKKITTFVAENKPKNRRL